MKRFIYSLAIWTLIMCSAGSISAQVNNNSYTDSKFWIAANAGMSELGQSYNQAGLTGEVGGYFTPGWLTVGMRFVNIRTDLKNNHPIEKAYDLHGMVGLVTPDRIPVRLALMTGIGLSNLQLYDDANKVKDVNNTSPDKYNITSSYVVSAPISLQLLFALTKNVGFDLDLNGTFNSKRTLYYGTAGIIIGRLWNSPQLKDRMF